MYPSSDQRISCVPPPELFPPMKDKQMLKKKIVEFFCYPSCSCAFSSDKISNFSRSPISINGNISSNTNKQQMMILNGRWVLEKSITVQCKQCNWGLACYVVGKYIKWGTSRSAKLNYSPFCPKSLPWFLITFLTISDLQPRCNFLRP